VSRVELLDAARAPLLARGYYGEDGSASPITRALAQVPELLDVALPFIARVFAETSLDLRTKEIVVLRTSARTGCRYCVETHTVSAWDAGLTPDETAGLCGRPAGLDERETALVAWCDALAAGGAVADADAARLREYFAEHEIVELTLLAGATLMLNRFCTALELPTSEATLERLSARMPRRTPPPTRSAPRSTRTASPTVCGCTRTTTATFAAVIA
jgi:AhpD family alkylhydroperoxidase